MEKAQFDDILLKKTLERQDRMNKYRGPAEELKAIYDAYRMSGFSNEQAFELVKLILMK